LDRRGRPSDRRPSRALRQRRAGRRGDAPDRRPPGGLMSDDLYADGMAVRRAVLGDEHVDRAIANTTDFTQPFQDYITASAWGAVWGRDGLDRRSRSMITLALLTALHCHGALPMHVRAARRNR